MLLFVTCDLHCPCITWPTGVGKLGLNRVRMTGLAGAGIAWTDCLVLFRSYLKFRGSLSTCGSLCGQKTRLASQLTGKLTSQ